MKSEGSRRRKQTQAINWDSTADEFKAFEKKSLYAAGYIQGVDFGVNVLEALPGLYATVESQIKLLAAEIKSGKAKK